MNYWHMVVSPDKDWNKENELLKKEKMIGISDIGTILEKFKSIEIGDVVLIRKNNYLVIALVKVIGEMKDIGNNDLNRLDWFQYRREVEVLEWATNKMKKFPTSRANLSKSSNKNSETYKYIDNWYRNFTNTFFNGIKLRKIYIENHKMFKGFNLNLTVNNKALNLVVVAGINGIGKTTLFNCIKNFTAVLNEKDQSLIKFKDIKENRIEVLNYKTLNEINYSKNIILEKFNKALIHIDSETNLDNIKDTIKKYLKKIIFKDDILASKAYQKLRDDISEIFGELDLHATFNRLDGDEEIYFKTTEDVEFKIDELSSGQKTLLSTILNLFLSDVKGKIILIDEPELSLHPTWQNKVLGIYERFAKKNNCQIIIATHSPHIIGSAKNEYLRILSFDENNNVEVINNIDKSFGLEFNNVLTEIMGVKEIRTPEIAKKIGKMWQLLEEEKYESKEYLELYLELEEILGDLDNDLLLARLEVAKLKAQNA